MVQIAARPKPVPRGRGVRRAEILRGAADAFREMGFQGASMKDLAMAAGMLPSNLYYYFEGKDDLLYACQKSALATLTAGARRIVASVASASEQVRAVAKAHVLCLLEETGGSAAHLEFRALPGKHRAEIARERATYERLVRSIVEAGVAAGELRRVDAKLATLALLGSLNSTVVWWRPDGPRRPLEIADAFADLAVASLKVGR